MSTSELCRERVADDMTLRDRIPHGRGLRLCHRLAPGSWVRGTGR